MADRCYTHRAKSCRVCEAVANHAHEFNGASVYSGGDWHCQCGTILPKNSPGEIKP